jgi:membrane associated rhomboid family serine protease
LSVRTRASVSEFFKFPVTAGIIGMAIAVTILGKTGRSIDPLTMNVLAFEGQPWRIWTSALPHADVLHILFNVMMLWTFGTVFEQIWGPLRTLAIFAVLQAGAVLGEYALFSSGIGLSGIVYGLFGMLVVLERRDPRFAGAMDTRTIWILVGWFFFCIVMTVFDVMAIANAAHGVGALVGYLLGLTLAGRGRAKRIAAGAGVAGVLAATVLGATLFRPIVNLSHYGGLDSAQLGLELLDKDRAESARHFRRAVEINPKDSPSWYNLGLAIYRMDDPEGAIEPFRRALALDPTDEQYRSGLAKAQALVKQRLEKSH